MPYIPKIKIGNTTYDVKDADAQEKLSALAPSHGLSLLKKLAAKQQYSDLFTLAMDGPELVITAIKNVSSGNGGVDVPLLPVDIHTIDFDYKCTNPNSFQLLLIAGSVSVAFRVFFVPENTHNEYVHASINLSDIVNTLLTTGHSQVLKFAVWNRVPMNNGDVLRIKNCQINAVDSVAGIVNQRLNNVLTPNYGLSLLRRFAKGDGSAQYFSLAMYGDELVLTATQNVPYGGGNGGPYIHLDLIDLHTLDFDYKCSSDTAYQMLLVGGYVGTKYFTLQQFKNTRGVYRHAHFDLTDKVNLIQHAVPDQDLKLTIWNLTPLTTGDTLQIKNMQINAFDVIPPCEKVVQSPLIGQSSDHSVGPWSSGEFTVVDHSILYTAPDSGNGGFFISPSKRDNVTNIRIWFNVRNKAEGGLMNIYIWDGSSSGGLSGHIYGIGGVTESGYIDVDLAHVSVYGPQTLDINNWCILVANASTFHSGVFNFNTIEIRDTTLGMRQEWEDKTGLEILADISSKIDTIPEPSVKDYMVSPSGKKVITQVLDDGTIVSTPVVPSKQLFLGNSLLAGFGFGMAASDYQHDYYYYISEYIKSLDPTYTSTKLASSAFEACTSAQEATTWMEQTLLPYLDDDLELVTIQLGDNVNTEAKQEAFPSNCLNLLRYIRTNCPRARVVWIGSWYASSLHPTIMSNCKRTGCEFINFYDLKNPDTCAYIGKVYNLGSVATRTYTFTRYTDDAVNHKLTITRTIDGTEYTSVLPYQSYSVSGSTLTVQTQYEIISSSGVASHPGDKGMAMIANRVLYKLGIAPTETVITIPDQR